MASYSTRKTPRDLPGSGWYALLPEPGPATELEGDLTVDWAIVGAGFAGLAAARRLRQLCPGARIAVLEAQRVGFGAAGRNSGFMIDLPHDLSSENYAGGAEADRRQIAMNRSAFAFAEEAVESYGLQDHFNPCGKYHGASNDRGLKTLRSFERHLENLGEPFEHLEAVDMKRVTGSDFYIGGLFAPGAAILQPAGYIRGFAEGLKKDGVLLFEESPVHEIESGPPHRLRCPKGSLSAKKVILTVNGHLTSFGILKGHLMHICLFASMTREMTATERQTLGGASEWALIPADPKGTTVRRLREDRIVIRNHIVYSPGLETSERQIARAGRRHDASFKARFPMLGSLEMEYRWAGFICVALNGAPAFGEIAEGVYMAGCQNGLGVCKGTLNGKLIADLATGHEDPLVQQTLALGQPNRLPPEPFLSLGASAHLWWAQWQAGSDL